MSEPKTILSLRVEPDLADRLDALARESRRTRSDELRIALIRHVALVQVEHKEESE
jgi:predicted transcriptional regulator